MLCYRCGSHVADDSESCPACGQKLAGGGVRQATGTFSRRRASVNIIEGAPYKPTDVVSGRYIIRDTVGVGPLGFVFRALDKGIDVEVALKVVNPKLVQTPDERKTFAKVMRNARRLSHTNLARVYEEGEDQDRPYFTSQFLDGLSLRKIIDLRIGKGQFFSLREIEPIFAQVADGLEAANKVGPHGGLKPENVLVLPDLLKLTDWGLALAVPRLPYVQALKVKGHDRYLAPELVDGSDVDGRIDVYAMGVVLGEMLTGLLPEGSIPDLHVRNPDVPHAVEGLYRKALNQNPNARFKTPAEFFAELAAVTRKIAPPLSRPRVETASALPPSRPRTTSGMLQLSTARSRPLPPVPNMPPPPPLSAENPISGSHENPNSTIPLEGARIKASLKRPTRPEQRIAPASPPTPVEGREDTEVIDSGQFIQVQELPKSRANEVGTQESPLTSRTTLWLAALTLAGLLLGAGGGYAIMQQMRGAHGGNEVEAVSPDAEKLSAQRVEAERAAAAKASPDNQAADKANAEAEATAAAQKAAADKAAAEKLAADKAAAEKVAGAKVEKVEPEKSAAQNTEAERLAADKLAAAEKARAEKLAADKAAAEKTQAEASAAEKAAAEKAAADKAAAEKAAADKKKAPEVAAVAAPTAAAGDGTCPEGMRPVPAGSFKMGTAKDDPMLNFDERALESVEVAAFCVDLFEFPNKRGAQPMVNVSWADAKRLCEARGKRLCTEAEWEKACKGPGNARWPYGSTFDANACNTEDDVGDDRTIGASGRFAKCRSGYGVADLSGNVAEWTQEKQQKGGSFSKPDYAVRCSARKALLSGAKAADVGFRCCQ